MGIKINPTKFQKRQVRQVKHPTTNPSQQHSTTENHTQYRPWSRRTARRCCTRLQTRSRTSLCVARGRSARGSGVESRGAEVVGVVVEGEHRLLRAGRAACLGDVGDVGLEGAAFGWRRGAVDGWVWVGGFGEGGWCHWAGGAGGWWV